MASVLELRAPVELDPQRAIHDCSAVEREVRRYLYLWLLTALIWMGCEGAALLGVGRSPLALTLENLVGNPWCINSLACGALFFACTRPGPRETLLALALGVFMGLGLGTVAALTAFALPALAALLIGFGLAGLTMLARRAWLNTGAVRSEALSLLLPGAIVPVFNALNIYFVLFTIAFCPQTLDATLFAADQGLGGQASFFFGRWLTVLTPVRLTAMLVYNTLPMAFLALFLLQRKANRLPNGSVFWPFIAAGLVGFWLYLLFPAVGPAAAFATFPYEPPSVEAVLAGPLAVPATVRNCMPSLHTTWALLLWWHARPLGRRVRAVACFYLAFTLLATLGYGEHYFFDLVVAFPFALAFQAACTPSANRLARLRLGGVILGAALTLSWLLLLAYGLPILTWSTPLTWAAVAGTVVVCPVWESRLYRAAQDPAGLAG